MARRRYGRESKERTSARLSRIADQLVGIGDRASVGQRAIYDLSNLVHRASQRVQRATAAEIQREERRTQTFTRGVLRQMFGER